jgi:hypothetical protein
MVNAALDEHEQSQDEEHRTPPCALLPILRGVS